MATFILNFIGSTYKSVENDIYVVSIKCPPYKYSQQSIFFYTETGIQSLLMCYISLFVYYA